MDNASAAASETISPAVRPVANTVLQWWLALGALMAVEIAVLALSGWFAGAIAEDTEGYQVPLTWPDAFAAMRHPLYAVFLRCFDPIGSHLMAIAIAQAAYHFIAAAILFREATRYGLGNAASFALAASAAVSQAFLFRGREALPEAPALASMLIAFAAVFRCASGARLSIGAACVAGLFAGIAYFLRPVFLAAIPVLPVVALLLARVKDNPFPARRGLAVAGAVALPFLLQSAIRLATVGDFNIVSFGGYQMASTAGLMIEPEHLAKYPDAIRPTAERILQGRTAAEQAGQVYATPLNSSNVRSFPSAAFGYFDIYARTVDNFISFQISKMQEPGESWVAFNKRMQAFSIATVRIVPERMAAWMVGGTSRFVGRALVTNAPLVVFTLVFVLVGTVRLLTRGHAAARVSPADWLVVAIVTVGYTVSAIAIAIVVTFPATRYIDTADALIPSIALLAAFAIGKRRDGVA